MEEYLRNARETVIYTKSLEDVLHYFLSGSFNRSLAGYTESSASTLLFTEPPLTD